MIREPLTVKDLQEICNRLIEGGCGDYTVSLLNVRVDVDDLGYDHHNKQLLIRPSVYNTVEVNNMTELQIAMAKATDIIKYALYKSELIFKKEDKNELP